MRKIPPDFGKSDARIRHFFVFQHTGFLPVFEGGKKAFFFVDFCQKNGRKIHLKLPENITDLVFNKL